MLTETALRFGHSRSSHLREMRRWLAGAWRRRRAAVLVWNGRAHSLELGWDRHTAVVWDRRSANRFVAPSAVLSGDRRRHPSRFHRGSAIIDNATVVLRHPLGMGNTEVLSRYKIVEWSLSSACNGGVCGQCAAPGKRDRFAL